MTEAARDRRLSPWRETEVHERGDAAAVAAWASRVPLDQIPSALALLVARLVSEGRPSRDAHQDGAHGSETEKLLTAGELAERLNVPESWVRTEQRAGRIPSKRFGKYVRFKLGDVERTLKSDGGVKGRHSGEGFADGWSGCTRAHHGSHVSRTVTDGEN